jgi:hypothetical protein
MVCGFRFITDQAETQKEWLAATFITPKKKK